MSFSMLDVLARAKVAFDGGDYDGTAKLLDEASEHCDRLSYAAAEIELSAEEEND